MDQRVVDFVSSFEILHSWRSRAAALVTLFTFQKSNKKFQR